MDRGVLLAGKDASFLKPLAARLGRLAMHVQVCASGQEAIGLAASQGFEIVIVERELSDMDAVVMCRTMRERGCAGAIFVCTDVYLAIDAVVAHEAGADDFLPKSIDPLVLEAKVRRGLRRLAQHRTASSDRIVAVPAFGLPSGVDARALTRFEERLLCLLASARGELVPANVLIKQLWGHERVEPRTLYEHVSTLRAKIRAAGWTLANVRGKGYRLEREPAFEDVAVSPSAEIGARSL